MTLVLILILENSSVSTAPSVKACFDEGQVHASNRRSGHQIRQRRQILRCDSTAVDGISFAAAAGETVALLGPSGCGKTTTLRLIAGFEEPDKGTIEIGGESMAGKRPYERNVGLLFQHYALFPAYDGAGERRLWAEAPRLAEGRDRRSGR